MDKIPVTCGQCGKRYAAPAGRIGSSLNCLACGTPIPVGVPAEPDLSLLDELPPASVESSRTVYLANPKPASRRRGSRWQMVLVLGGFAAMAVVAVLGVAVWQFGRSISPRQPVVVAGPAGESQYKRLRWREITNIAGGFRQWFPRIPIQSKTTGSLGRMTSFRSTAPSGAICNLAIVVSEVQTFDKPDLLEQLVAQQAASMPGGATVLSKEWKAIDGRKCLDVVARNRGAIEYMRFQGGTHWIAVHSWLVPPTAKLDEAHREMFFTGFKPPGS